MLAKTSHTNPTEGAVLQISRYKATGQQQTATLEPISTLVPLKLDSNNGENSQQQQ
jgi:hypothetical protein